jgi:hypothetical protein
MKLLLSFTLLFAGHCGLAQVGTVSGTVTSNGQVVTFVNVVIQGTNRGASTDEEGTFSH